VSSFKLHIELLEEVVIFDGAFIEFLLNASFTDSLVGDVVKLGDKKIVEARLRIRSHNVVDSCDLLLECNHSIHQIHSDGLVLDLSDLILVLVDLLVDLLDLFVDALSKF